MSCCFERARTRLHVEAVLAGAIAIVTMQPVPRLAALPAER